MVQVEKNYGHLRNRAGYCLYMDTAPCGAQSCISGNAINRVVAAPCNDTQILFGAQRWGTGTGWSGRHAMAMLYAGLARSALLGPAGR